MPACAEPLCPEGDMVIYRDRTIHVAGWAKRFLFRDDQLDMPVSRLSGGERARVMIARLMLTTADVLLLDEPTNDLDIPTLEVLEDSLLDFPGALVLVSHDRYMLDRVSTMVIGLDGGRRRYLRRLLPMGSVSQRAGGPGENAVQRIAPGALPDEPKKKLSYLHQREWDGMEAKILEAEQELGRVPAANSKPLHRTPNASPKPTKKCRLRSAAWRSYMRAGRNWRGWWSDRSESRRGKTHRISGCGLAWHRPGLRNEQRSHEKWMRGHFHDPHFIILIPARDLQSMFLQLILVLGIESEVAIELLHRSRGVARPRLPCFPPDGHLHGLSTSEQLSGVMNRQVASGCDSAWDAPVNPITFRAYSIDQMLKAATSAHERNIVFARVSNSGQRSFQASIRASWAASNP